MGMAAILVMWPLLFVINFTPLNLWVSIWNLSSIGHVFSEKTVLNNDGTPIWETLAERSTLTFGTYL